MRAYTNSWKRPLRILSCALIISLSINVILAAWIVYLKLNDPVMVWPLAQAAEIYTYPSIQLSNEEIYNEFRQLRTDTLAKHLQDERLAEEGLKVRDIALAILVRERFFDVDRALGYHPVGREVVIGQVRLPIYSHLSSQQYNVLALFGRREKWPMTSQGMYIVLKSLSEPNSSLEETFMLTDCFQKVSKLFPKTEKKQILRMLLEGSWELLADLPPNGVAALLKYIENGSTTAASLLINLEPLHAIKRLDDAAVLNILSLLNERSPAVAKFALSMLASQRGDEVKAAAMQRLTAMTEKSAFLASLQPAKEVKMVPNRIVPPFEQGKYHTVQPGDNLWKIAKKWKVSLDELKRRNRLTDDTILRPGSVLAIP